MTLPGHDPRLGPLLLARSRPAASRSTERSDIYSLGHRPVRAAHRPPPVRGRLGRRDRDGPPERTRADAVELPGGDPGRARGDRPQGARARSRRRFSSAAAMADALEGWLSGRSAPGAWRRAVAPLVERCRSRRRDRARCRGLASRPAAAAGAAACRAGLGHRRRRRRPLECRCRALPARRLRQRRAAVADPARAAGQPLRLVRRRARALGDQPVGLDRRPARPGDPRRGRLPDLQAADRHVRRAEPGGRAQLRRPAADRCPDDRRRTTA